MPRRRGGHTTAVTIGAERFYITANQHDDGGLERGGTAVVQDPQHLVADLRSGRAASR